MPIRNKIQKTPLPSINEINREWWVVDAKDKVLGRLASQVARIVRGKHKPNFTSNIDVGDFVIIVNARHIKVTGKKYTQKEYRWYTGYPGGLKSTLYADLLRKNPVKLVRHAVQGMLPHNRLGRKLLKKVKIYPDEAHPHMAQKPKILQINK